MVSVSVLLCSNRVDNNFYKSIESIIEQDFKDLELIIVLNGEAISYSESIKMKFIDFNNVNILCANLKGLNYSLNYALNYSLGKYIARMDADDISYSDRISIQHEFLEKNPDVDVCGSWFYLIDSAGLVIEQVQRPLTNQDIRAALTFRNPLCHPSVMYRRDLVCNIGGYMNGEFAEDYDLWVRLARSPSIKFANIGKPLLGYRVSSDGEARGSKSAYRAVSTTQWAEFIRSGSPKWLIASIFFSIKAMILGK